jgi:hypothetical protein
MVVFTYTLHSKEPLVGNSIISRLHDAGLQVNCSYPRTGVVDADFKGNVT